MRIALLLTLLLPTLVFSNLVPNDYDYYKIDDSRFSLYFDLDTEKEARSSLNTLHRLTSFYEKSFNFQLETNPNIVFSSEKNQIANAFATSAIGYLNFYYRGGAMLVDEFAVKSWKFTLLTHEMSHLYQLGTKDGLAKFMRKIFGSPAEPHILFFIPIFTTPNELLPTWILEGNAVLNESLWGNGGRLFSGEEWALFLALMKSEKMHNRRFVNNHIEFPFGHEKYNIGGYFAEYLSRTFGVDKTNSFFLAHGNNYINPLLLNGTFYKTFGKTYYELVSEFIVYYQSLAKNQIQLTGETLSSSQFENPLNSDQTEIYTLVNQTGAGRPELIKISKENESMTSSESLLPTGKIIKMNNEYYSVRSGQTELDRFEYSLWSDRYHDLLEYRSKALLTNNGGELYVDTKNSFDRPIVYLNEKKLGEYESLPIIDKEGNIFSFRQNEKQRTLLINGVELTSFLGYYGKLLEVSGDLVTFIAPTEFGSSLFAYDMKEKKTIRLSKADNITDARFWGSENFVATTVTEKGYQLVKAKIEQHEQSPTELKYDFEKNKIPEVVTTEFYAKKEEVTPWNSLTYAGMPLQITSLSGHLLTSISPTFADPLGHHTIVGNYLNDTYYDYQNASIYYINSKNIINWFTGFQYTDRYESEYQYLIGAKALFYKNGMWNFNLFESVDINQDGDFGNYVAFTVDAKENYPLSFYPYKTHAFSLENDIDNEATENAITLSTRLSNKNNWSLFIDGTYKEGDNFDLELGTPISSTIAHNSTFPTTEIYFDGKDHQSMRAGLGLSKAIDTPIYFEIFPLSLRRTALKVVGNYYKHDKGIFYSADYLETGFGVDFEILALHLAPIHLEYMNYDRDGMNETSVGLTVAGEF